MYVDDTSWWVWIQTQEKQGISFPSHIRRRDAYHVAESELTFFPVRWKNIGVDRQT